MVHSYNVMHLPTIYNVIKIIPDVDSVRLKLQRATDKNDVFEVEILKTDKGEKIESILDVNLPKYYYKYSARIVENGIKGDCLMLSPLNDEEKIDWSMIKDGDISKLQYIYEFVKS